MTQYGKTLRAVATTIPGLTIWELAVHGDNRGWFKENWQREKMIAAGMPDFGPVQHNISFNDAAGTTRGIHAEPWDKFISVGSGRVFGAWLDLREGPTFGVVFTAELDPSCAVFVPRGVANSFQTLEPNTVYSYLVNDHYSPDVAYPSVNPADETLAIAWPIPLERAELSAKDRAQGPLVDVTPIPPRKTLVIGAGGQVGRALRAAYADTAHIEFADRADVDLTSGNLSSARNWSEYDTIINAAAFTAVDTAETAEGRAAAWAANVSGIAALVNVAAEHRLTMVHLSSDYVFDGTAPRPYREDDPIAPLGVYGQTKAAGPPLHPAHLLGDRRRAELRAHHAVPGRAWRGSGGGRRPVRSVDVYLRTGPRDPASASDAGTLRDVQRDGVRVGHLVGGCGATHLCARRLRSGSGERGFNRGVLRQGDGSCRATPGQQCS